ncbi:MAG: hypothetical protein ACI4UT_01070 [Candidatus Enteromonas sp.]
MAKEKYYQALNQSSLHWTEGKNDDTPFVKYFLGILLSAYRDFEERVNLFGEKRSAKDIVYEAVKRKIGRFTKQDILELCPEIGKTSVENSLKASCEEGVVQREVKGKSTVYYMK